MSINKSISTRNIILLHKFARCFGLTPTDGLSTKHTRVKSKVFSFLLLTLLLSGYLYSIQGRFRYNYPMIMPSAMITDFMSYTMICLSNVASILEIGIVKCDKLKSFVTKIEKINKMTEETRSRKKSQVFFLLEFVLLHTHITLYISAASYYFVTYFYYFFKYFGLQFLQQYLVVVLVLLIHNCVMSLKYSFKNVNADLVRHVRNYINFNTARNVKMKRSCSNLSVIHARDDFHGNDFHGVVRTYLELLDLTNICNDVFGYQMLILMGKIFTDMLVPLNFMTYFVPRNMAEDMLINLNIFCVLWSTLGMVSSISYKLRKLGFEIICSSVEMLLNPSHFLLYVEFN